MSPALLFLVILGMSCVGKDTICCKDKEPILEFRVLSGNQEVLSYEQLRELYKTGSSLLGDPVIFKIESAKIMPVEKGYYSAGTGDLSDSESELESGFEVLVWLGGTGRSAAGAVSFGDFSESSVGHQVLIIKDGEVLSCPTITSRLPAEVILFAPTGNLLGEQEAKDLVRTLSKRCRGGDCCGPCAKT